MQVILPVVWYFVAVDHKMQSIYIYVTLYLVYWIQSGTKLNKRLLSDLIK